MRISRINKELKKYLQQDIFSQLTCDLASYILEVVDNLLQVMKRELDSRMDEIRTQSIVAKFGATREQIEAMLGAAVRVAIPNDYLAVHQAMMSGQPLPSDSRLGKHFDDLARNLMEIPAIGVTRKRRFFEYLSLGSPEPATPGNSDK